MLRILFTTTLLSAAPLAQTVDTSERGATLGPNHALSRLDLRLAAGAGALVGSGTSVGEVEALMSFRARRLGPLTFQVGAAYGFGAPADSAAGPSLRVSPELHKMTAGVGLSTADAPLRSWVMANVWAQSYRPNTSLALTLGGGIDVRATERIGLTVGARLLLGDPRVEGDDRGVLATATAGLQLTM